MRWRRPAAADHAILHPVYTRIIDAVYSGSVMKTLSLTLIATVALTPFVFSEGGNALVAKQKPTPVVLKIEPSKVDYNGFRLLTQEVRDYRKSRMVTLDQFNAMSTDKGTIILDTRSASAFKGLHMKGAVHLNFSDFTATKLAKVIPNKKTRILIYCNNNFKDNKRFFEGKAMPLALNIPTFINLYGYGYKNIYELSENLSVKDKRLKLAGTDAR
jgi:hypothetical protein